MSGCHDCQLRHGHARDCSERVKETEESLESSSEDLAAALQENEELDIRVTALANDLAAERNRSQKLVLLCEEVIVGRLNREGLREALKGVMGE